jgi:hypothetical protein
VSVASPNPQNVYGKVQLTYDVKLNTVLERAAKDIQRRIAGLPVGVGGDVRKAQLQLVLNEIRNIQQAMWTQGVLPTITSGQRDAAKAAENAAEALNRVLYASLPERVAEVVSGGLKATAMAGIERDHARVPRELSQRVYHDFALTSGQVEKTIRAGLVSGLSARELAKDVYQYISPTTPGGASYAAMRLARTEINNAFHEQQKKGADRPGVKAVRWHLSGSHKKPDLCNVYASQDVDDLGSGLYESGNVPGKPHPQCLCYLTYETMSSAEFERALKAGKFDDELDRRIQANLDRLGRPSVSNPTPKPTGHHPEAVRANKMPEGNDRDRVQAILDKQAELAPKAMARLDRVARATHQEQIEMGHDGLGGYLPRERRIALGHDAFSAKANRAWHAEVKSKWSANTPVDGVEGLVSHEFGHHVANALNNIPQEAKRLFWRATAEDLGLKPPSLYDTRTLDRWLQRNADVISSKVSRYAVADGEVGEMLAEIWLEYSTNPRASAWARSIGQRMREVSEG